MTHSGLGTLTNELLMDPRFGKVAVITSATTGNPALATIDLAKADTVVALQYVGEGQSGGVQLADIGQQVTQEHFVGAFDLAMVDPFHTYGSSLQCLELALNMLRPAGVLLVHDCLPPLEYADPAFISGNWCGTTFAAFRDLCTANELAWFTLATDMGIGVAVKGANPVERRVAEDQWTEQTHEEYLARYATDPCEFMRAIDSGDARNALELALVGAEAGHLRMSFTDWPDFSAKIHESSDRSRQRVLDEMRELRDEVDSLSEQIRALDVERETLDAVNHELREQVVNLHSHLREMRRPTWQARALLKSAPRAAGDRLARRVRRTDR